MRRFLTLQLSLCFVAFLMLLRGYEEMLLVTGIASIVIYAFIAVRESGNEKWILSPLVAYLGMSVLYVGVASIWAYACLVTGNERVFTIGYLKFADEIPLAQAFCLLGVTCFYTGYKLSERGRILRIIESWKKRSRDLKLSATGWMIVIAVAWLFRVLPLLGIPVNKIGVMYNSICELTMLGAFFMLTCRTGFTGSELRIRPTGAYMPLAIFVAIVDLLFHGLRSGMRHPILNLIILFLWGYILQRELHLRSRFLIRRARAWILPMLLGIAAVTLIMTVIAPFGKRIAKGERVPERDDIMYNIINIGETFPDRGIWTMPDRISTSIQGVAACIQLRKLMPPQKKVAPQVLIGIVPRIIWHGKPYVTQGAKFSILLGLGGGKDERTATTATGMTAIGELYWSYGPLGVIIGMTILGLMFGVSFRMLSYNFPMHPIRAWVIPMLVLSAFMWFEADATAVYVFIIYIWVVFYPLSLINFSWMRKPGGH